MSCPPRLCHVSIFHCATCEPQFVSTVRFTSCHNVSCVLISCHVSAPHHATVCHMSNPYGATCHNLCHVMPRVNLTTISMSCQVSVPCRVTCRSSRIPKWHVMPRVDHPAYPSEMSCSMSSILWSKWLSDTCQNVSHHAMCQHNIMPHVILALHHMSVYEHATTLPHVKSCDTLCHMPVQLHATCRNLCMSCVILASN